MKFCTLTLILAYLCGCGIPSGIPGHNCAISFENRSSLSINDAYCQNEFGKWGGGVLAPGTSKTMGFVGFSPADDTTVCFKPEGRPAITASFNIRSVAVHSAQHGGSSWFLEVHDSEFESGAVAAVFTWPVTCSVAPTTPVARRSFRASSMREASASSPVGESN